MGLLQRENLDGEQVADYKHSVIDGNINGIAYCLVTIPKNDSEGRRLELKVGVADNTPGHVKTVEEFAEEKGAYVTINAGFFHMKDGTNLPYGTVIIDGQPVYNGSPYKNVRNAKSLAIMADGTFQYYASNSLDIDAMIADGVRQAVTGRLPIITMGTETDYDDTEGRFQIVGYDEKNYYIFTTEDGMRISEAAAFLLKQGLLEAYVMDGGGSVATNLCQKRIIWDKNDGTKTIKAERKVATFLYGVR